MMVLLERRARKILLNGSSGNRKGKEVSANYEGGIWEMSNVSTVTHITQQVKNRKKAFLAVYAQLGNIKNAAEIAEIDRTTHYDWLKNDPEYVLDFADAELQAGEHLEQEARRRAVEGVEKPVFYQGKQCGTIREYSDTLLIFLLKGAMPEKYRDRTTVDVSVQQAQPWDIRSIRDLRDMLIKGGDEVGEIVAEVIEQGKDES